MTNTFEIAIVGRRGADFRVANNGRTGQSRGVLGGDDDPARKLAEALQDLALRSRQVAFASAVATANVPLYAEEQALSASYTPMRREQFACGRNAARTALARLGLEQTAVGTTHEGLPLFPNGVVGSISHKHRCGVAAVAFSRDVRSVGIDIEMDEDSDEEDLLERVQTANEVGLVERLRLAGFCSPATWLLSAKEAVYKCVFAIDRVDFDFEDVELDVDQRAQTFAVTRLLGSVRPDIACNYTAKGRWLICVAILAT